jgi:hypothetical protein
MSMLKNRVTEKNWPYWPARTITILAPETVLTVLGLAKTRSEFVPKSVTYAS